MARCQAEKLGTGQIPGNAAAHAALASLPAMHMMVVLVVFGCLDIQIVASIAREGEIEELHEKGT